VGDGEPLSPRGPGRSRTDVTAFDSDCTAIDCTAIDAERAAGWGLVNRAVDPVEFGDIVAEYVADMASGPPVALKVAKSPLNHAEDTSLAAGLAMESQGFGFLTTTEDFAEGRRAVREKREPEFDGW